VDDGAVWDPSRISADLGKGVFRIARADRSQGRHCQALGSWGSGKLERAGQLGEGWGKQGQFTSNLRWRRTIPVTAGGGQVSESGV
jgi:hypothetical protein